MFKWVALSCVGIGLPYIFGLFGLSTLGPIAGGVFSTMQGSGIAAGSFMALAQSFVMSGWALVIQTYTIGFWCMWLLIKSIFRCRKTAD